MNGTRVTLAGNVASELTHRQLDDGRHVVNFRLATSRRWRDRGSGEWRDGPTSFYSVSCWRALAQNVAGSLGKGDPVVVVGDLTLRQWEDGERRGTSADIEADAVGHDLTRGVSRFRRVARAVPVQVSDADGRLVAQLERDLGPVDRTTGEVLRPSGQGGQGAPSAAAPAASPGDSVRGGGAGEHPPEDLPEGLDDELEDGLDDELDEALEEELVEAR